MNGRRARGIGLEPTSPEALGSTRTEGARVQVPLESPEAVTTMLKCNCRPCSHVVDAGQRTVHFRALGGNE